MRHYCLSCASSYAAPEGGPCPRCGAIPHVVRLSGRGRRNAPGVGEPDLIFRTDRPSSWMGSKLIALGQRDGWRCHLCKLPVPMVVKRNHPGAPSRDHVVPQMKEKHLLDNIRLAHNWCNTHRGSREIAGLNSDEFKSGILARVPELRLTLPVRRRTTDG